MPILNQVVTMPIEVVFDLPAGEETALIFEPSDTVPGEYTYGTIAQSIIEGTHKGHEFSHHVEYFIVAYDLGASRFLPPHEVRQEILDRIPADATQKTKMNFYKESYVFEVIEYIKACRVNMEAGVKVEDRTVNELSVQDDFDDARTALSQYVRDSHEQYVQYYENLDAHQEPRFGE